MLPQRAPRENENEHVISFEEFVERFGITANAGSNRNPDRNVPTNRQRRLSNESTSGSDNASQNSASCSKKQEIKDAATAHALQMLQGLDELRKEGSFCDVTLQVGEKEFPAHKNVLASFSSYFKAMFTGNLLEARQDRVLINGIDATMLQTLIDYAYTGKVEVTVHNVQNLLAASNLLGVLPVRDACCRFLQQHTEESNCVGIHCFAESHACTELQEWSKEYILSHFTDVVKHEEMLGMPMAKLIEIISDEEICIEREEIVFKAAIKWLEHNVEARRAEFYKVLEHVRLPLVSPYLLHDYVEIQPVLLAEERCRRLVAEAEWFHLMPDRRHELHTVRTQMRRSTGLQDVIVAVGGEDDKVVLRSVEYYDPVTSKWKTLSCLPFAVSKHGLVASGQNNMFLAGGEFPDGSASRSLWRYDPVLDLWWEMAPMLVARSELGLAVLDGCLYAVGGWEGTCRLDTVERFDPELNTWELIAPMKLAVTSPAVVAHGGMLYVTGGAILEDGDGIELVQRYDPKSDTWSDLKPMLIPRSGSAACILDGKIFVIGGWHASTENTNKVECYDFETGTWQFKASMCERRYRPGVAVVNQKIYVLGGEEGWDRYHDTIECYDPKTDAWSMVGEMHTSRSWLSCVTLQVKLNHPLMLPDMDGVPCTHLLNRSESNTSLGPPDPRTSSRFRGLRPRI